MEEQRIKARAASRLPESLALAALLLLGLGPRLALVTAFPTVPISDFRGLLNLALDIRDVSWKVQDYHWDLYSPGLPLLLSILLRIFPGSPETVARMATAVACGLLPLLPFGIWRGALPLWARTLAGGMLALWPGQILFSGVVAQDNWVLIPTLALGSLAVRSLLAREGGHPVAAGLLYGLGVAMRQEMLVVLAPLLLAAGGMGEPRGRRLRALSLLLVMTLLPLLALATYRYLATGRFGLTSKHGGLAILGAYIPGSTANYWADPIPYIASVEPDLLSDRRRLQESGLRLALAELRRRPRFHLARIVASAAELSLAGEGANLYWSLGSPDVLPAPRRERAAVLVARAARLLPIEMAILHGLFLASLLLGLLRRNPAILVLSLAILLKIALHAVLVAQGRYFLASTALEILVIALGAWVASRASARVAVTCLAAGAAGALFLSFAAPRLAAAVRLRDQDVQRVYRFPVDAPDGSASLQCVIASGRLVGIAAGVPTLEPYHRDPSPGETAAADCAVTGKSSSPLTLRLRDGYGPGGLPRRMLQRVLVDGREVLSHDLAAEPGEGWLEVPLGPVPPGARKTVRIEIVAVNPDPGAAWGKAASTPFQLLTSGGPK